MIDALMASSTKWSDQLFVGLLVFALRATVLLAGAWLATRLLRRSSAATRHLIWTAAVAGVLVLPVLTAVGPSWNVPMFTIPAKTDVPLAPSINAELPQAPLREERATTAAPVATVSGPVTPEPAPASTASWMERVSLTSATAVAWLCVALLLLVRLAIANARVSGWRRASHAIDDARWNTLLRRLTRDYRIDRPVVLLENGDTDVPVTWGIVYPVVLLPESAEQWDEEQRVAVLTHELAHVKRFDALSQMLGQMVLALLWFHPLAWTAVRRMRLEREHACDDFVLAAGARASRYADDLLGLARRLARPTAPAAAALAMARRSELEGRLLAILDPDVRRGTVQRARVGVLTLLVFALAIPLAAFTPGTRVTTTPAASGPQMAAMHSAKPTPPSAAPAVASPRAPTARTNGDSTMSRELDALITRLGAVTPVTPKLEQKLPSLSRIQRDSEPQAAPIDVQTLVDVTRAAKRMTNDYEKGQLLALIAKRYVRNDTLRDAYLDAVFTMTSDHERTKALIALLQRDSIPSYSTAKVLRSAAVMTSDASRGLVLKSISPTTFSDTLVQRAYMEVIVAMTSDHERTQAIGKLMKQPGLSQGVQLALLRSTNAISSSTSKADALLVFLKYQSIADDVVRKSFMKSAEGLTSDYDYRRVMSEIMR